MDAKSTYFSNKQYINCSGNLISLKEPIVMGILNISKDSFYDGGKYTKETAWLARAEKIFAEGATIIDVGAMSTKPGSKAIAEEEETNKIKETVSSIRKHFPQSIISVDTYRAKVASLAKHCGADIINDISAGMFDSAMFETIATLKMPYIIMHIQGTPGDMQLNPVYKNVVKEIILFMAERVNKLKSLGVCDILIDPGFGFGKTVAHNYELLNNLDMMKILELPLLVGLSRKSMINKVLDIKASEALNGTTSLNTIALMKGANILRVHDVKEAIETIKLVNELNKSENSC